LCGTQCIGFGIGFGFVKKLALAGEKETIKVRAKKETIPLTDATNSIYVHA